MTIIEAWLGRDFTVIIGQWRRWILFELREETKWWIWIWDEAEWRWSNKNSSDSNELLDDEFKWYSESESFNNDWFNNSFWNPVFVELVLL